MVKKEFKKADADKSGAVDPKEMGAYIFEAVDANDDGLISLDELLGAIKAIAKFSKNKLVKGWKGMVKNAVKGVDTDGDGKASPAELWAAIEEHGIPDINDLFEDNSKALKLADLLQVGGHHVPSP
jgi:Ca2+-binding EF-hand superfamily protein